MNEVTALRSLLTFGDEAAGRSSASSGQPAARSESDRSLQPPATGDCSYPAGGATSKGNPPSPGVGEKQQAAVRGGSDAIPAPGAAASQLKSTAGACPASPLSAEGTLCRAR